MVQAEADPIQLVFFGPGYGESILLNLGDDHWVVIDSCLNEAHEPAPLGYLRGIGRDPKRCVKLVIATHWHDDHIKGLSRVLAECEEASFAIASAMTGRDFLAYLIAYERQPNTALDKGGTEFIKCLELVQSSSRQRIWLGKDRVVKSWDAGHFSHGQDVELLALSPSDMAFHEFLDSMTAFFASIGPEKHKNPPKARVGRSGRNDLSVAVLLTVGNFSILLGADVETVPDPNRGWMDIVAGRRGRTPRPHLFKIAHHGSAGAHCDELWEDVLSEKPIAVVTPWRVGGNQLPTADDCKRIVDRSSAAYITSAVRLSMKKRYDRTVIKLIEHGAVSLEPALFSCGAVNVEIDARNGDLLKVELRDGAQKL